MSNKTVAAPRRHGPGGMGPQGGASGEKAKNFKSSIGQLINYLGNYKYLIIIVWVLAITSTVFSIVGPKILGNATDELFKGLMAQIAGTGYINFDSIGSILMLLVTIYCISAFLSYFQSYIMSGITADVSKRLRDEMNQKMHKLPLSYYDKKTHGEVLSHMTNDVDTISQSLNQSITQIITSVASLIGILIMMFSISWQLSLIALVSLPVSMLSVMGIIKKSQQYFVQQQVSLGAVNGHVEEMFGSHVIVKAFNGEKESERVFNESNEALYNSSWKANFLSGLMMPITTFIGNITYVLICIAGGYFAANGSMTVGGIQSFIQYVRSFNQPISQIANISNVLQQTAAAAERVFEFLGETEEVPDNANAIIPPKDIDAEAREAKRDLVVFDHVNFGYNNDTPVIHDFSAVVKPGQKVAIVGPTGAGKTTIVKLLMRFYDVTQGAIYLNGHDIREYTRDTLRQSFGMVLQDTWLYSGTIQENIRYGKLDATDEEVERAAKAAQVDHFVRTLPNGYLSEINEEATNISQGQKQLLTIARAILADPEVLILDEATSSIDTRTEILIQKAMDNLMKNRTSFVIAHRLSTIRNADLILVMNEGDIVEQGTHDTLLARDGFYAKLYNSQFEEEE